MSLPSIVRGKDNGRQQSTDQNYNRPKQQGGGEEFPTSDEKYAKLETWMEDKIRQILGPGSSRTEILAHHFGNTGDHTVVSGDEGAGPAMRDPSNTSTSALLPPLTADSGGNNEPVHRGNTSSLSAGVASRASGTLTDVGSFLSRLRSEMGSDSEAGAEHNPGLRVEMRELGRSSTSLSASEIGALLNPVPTEPREVPQDVEDIDVDHAGGGGEGAEVIERRARFDRSMRMKEAKEGRKAVPAAGSKTPKRVGWNLSPRESEADNMSEAGAETLRLSTGGGRDSSRPVTGSSSRPDTSGSAASSFIADDDDDEEADTGDGSQARLRSGEQPAGDVVKDFFSKVRHNKVAECEEQVQAGFPMSVRDRHGNTPLLVAAQNGHKRLVKMFLPGWRRRQRHQPPGQHGAALHHVLRVPEPGQLHVVQGRRRHPHQYEGSHVLRRARLTPPSPPICHICWVFPGLNRPLPGSVRGMR